MIPKGNIFLDGAGGCDCGVVEALSEEASLLAGDFGERQGRRTIVAAAHKRSAMRAGIGTKSTASQREEEYTLRKSYVIEV